MADAYHVGQAVWATWGVYSFAARVHQLLSPGVYLVVPEEYDGAARALGLHCWQAREDTLATRAGPDWGKPREPVTPPGGMRPDVWDGMTRSDQVDHLLARIEKAHDEANMDPEPDSWIAIASEDLARLRLLLL